MGKRKPGLTLTEAQDAVQAVAKIFDALHDHDLFDLLANPYPIAHPVTKDYLGVLDAIRYLKQDLELEVERLERRTHAQSPNQCD
jgi:hypothetical protein